MVIIHILIDKFSAVRLHLTKPRGGMSGAVPPAQEHRTGG